MSVAVGSIIQIKPEHDPRFGGCLMQVSELKSWGVQCFLRMPGDVFGSAYYRCPFEGFEETGGVAVFGPGDGSNNI